MKLAFPVFFISIVFSDYVVSFTHCMLKLRLNGLNVWIQILYESIFLSEFSLIVDTSKRYFVTTEPIVWVYILYIDDLRLR